MLEKTLLKAEYEAKREHYKKLNAEGGPIRYGIGFALSHRGCSLGAEGLDASSALIQVNADASVNISTSVSENGQGLQTTMSLLAAEAFGIGLDRVMFSEPYHRDDRRRRLNGRFARYPDGRTGDSERGEQN